MKFVSVISTSIDDAHRRIVKFFGMGKRAFTATDASPYGIDSNPIAGMVAIYAESDQNGKTVIIGYLNTNKLAQIGELRLYSTDKNGNEKFYTWLKNDGTYEIGGNADNSVRYSKLAAAFNELQGKFNTFAAAYTPGSPAILGTPPTIAQSTGDITQAKINEIKTS